jgi:hypothetical protein
MDDALSRVSVRLPVRQHDQLAIIAMRRRTSVSELVRRIVSIGLSRIPSAENTNR